MRPTSYGELSTPVPGRGRPVKKIRNGTGMLVLKRPLRWDGEVWTVGKERVHPSHPAAIAMPDAFEPADPTDAATRSKHGALLSRSRRVRPRVSAGCGGGPWRLERPWRLAPAAASRRPTWRI